jgi:hypothetical protein
MCDKDKKISTLKAREQHLMDVYDSLGIKWGDDPFHAISTLKGITVKQKMVISSLEAKVKRLREEIKTQIELWEIEEPLVNAVDDSRHQVRFMKLHSPIGSAKQALKDTEDV